MSESISAIVRSVPPVSPSSGSQPTLIPLLVRQLLGIPRLPVLPLVVVLLLEDEVYEPVVAEVVLEAARTVLVPAAFVALWALTALTGATYELELLDCVL